MISNIESITETVSRLILSKKENDYYDFKRQWHEKPEKLVHDIICMANVITYECDRYIIFGVDNNKFEIVGVGNDTHRKDQQKVICVLKDHDFNGDYRPDIELVTITLEGKSLDVLIIKDKPFKPYLLRKANKSENILSCIYTRVGDTNTPIDSSADYNFIEKMFEERFGLNKSPLERMALYLLDYPNWKRIDYIDNEDVTQYYYSKFPEFTIRWFKDSIEAVNWPERDIFQKKFNSHVVEYLYHSTVLHHSCALESEDGRLCFPRPEAWDLFHHNKKSYSIYYNYTNTIASNVKCFLENIFIVSSGFHNRNHYQFIAFEDESEKRLFCDSENQKKVFEAFFSSGHKEKKNNEGNDENHQIEKEFRIFAWEYYNTKWKKDSIPQTL